MSAMVGFRAGNANIFSFLPPGALRIFCGIQKKISFSMKKRKKKTLEAKSGS